VSCQSVSDADADADVSDADVRSKLTQKIFASEKIEGNRDGADDGPQMAAEGRKQKGGAFCLIPYLVPVRTLRKCE
jgi:hypothetical protein